MTHKNILSVVFMGGPVSTQILEIARLTDKQTVSQTDRQTDRQSDRQTDRQTDRLTVAVMAPFLVTV